MASCGSLLWRTVAAFPSVSREVNLCAHPNTQLKCSMVEREIHTESRYLLCILIHFPWLWQESNNNNNNKKSTEQWAKNFLELAPNTKYLQSFSLKLFCLSFYTYHMYSLLVWFLLPPFFSASLFLQQSLLQLHNISHRTRRGEAVLLLGACAPSLGCKGQTAMVTTPSYGREIRTTRFLATVLKQVAMIRHSPSCWFLRSLTKCLITQLFNFFHLGLIMLTIPECNTGKVLLHQTSSNLLMQTFLWCTFERPLDLRDCPKYFILGRRKQRTK